MGDVSKRQQKKNEDFQRREANLLDPKKLTNGLTVDKILQIAKSKGYFHVTLNYRDSRLRARCFALERKGILRRNTRKPTDSTWYLVPTTPEPIARAHGREG